jgi:hypothetical protein
MTRISLFRTLFRTVPFRNTLSVRDSIAWGKINLGTIASPLVFAAILIVCSLAVGCSSEKPKTELAANQPTAPLSQPPVTTPPPATPAPVAAKPVHKKAARRLPTTITYTDKTSGVSFQYPRRYELKTGEAADELISSDPIPMDFVQPGGVAIAAVVVPEGIYPKSNLASARFDVSVSKSLTAEQCAQFSVPQGSPQPQPSKLMIGRMELQSAENLATADTREQASKYYHVFENVACYEFALQVATTKGETDEGGKAVDRDEVFGRLEKILATVKINPVATPEVAASDTPAATQTPTTPAQ